MAGLQFGLGFAKTIFWGLDFRKTETNLFLDFVRAEEGSGEECGRDSLRVSFGERRTEILNTVYQNCLGISLAMWLSKSKGDAPSASASGISARATSA